jgi:hypothetical protein
MRSIRLVTVSTLSIIGFLFAAPSVLSSGLVESTEPADPSTAEVRLLDGIVEPAERPDGQSASPLAFMGTARR